LNGRKARAGPPPFPFATGTQTATSPSLKVDITGQQLLSGIRHAHFSRTLNTKLSGGRKWRSFCATQKRVTVLAVRFNLMLCALDS
jgi:hypothetical protein